MFERLRRYWKPIVALTVLDGVGSLALYKFYIEYKREDGLKAAPKEIMQAMEWRPPRRVHLLERLKGHGQPEHELDVLIIGGGATGTGCALDAAARGLKVACLEAEDWASGTSSKSTKLIHGGVRYLQKAITELDVEQYKLVDEALRERRTVLKIAPHLTDQLPILLPVYKWYMIPYFWVGSKMYDLVAGSAGLEDSYYMSRSRVLKAFPMLNPRSLAGAMVYYDGTQNDSRMNLTLALTALHHGALVTNYTRVISLIKEQSVLKGAIVEDVISGERWPVRAKVVINATGPFCDVIRQMDDPKTEALVKPSSGTHIVLPSYFSPRGMGLIDPATKDGRVMFFLPWEGGVIAGTTDASDEITTEPQATESEINFILQGLETFVTPQVAVRRSDVLAAWKGLRPLVRDPNAASTEALVRNHLIHESPSGLITIAGGKWTTYRHMAKETIDHAIKKGSLQPPSPSADTSKMLLIGAHGYTPIDYIRLVQNIGLEVDTAQHLARSYGDRAGFVTELMEKGDRISGYGRRLSRIHPYDEAEVRWACRNEYALSAVDVLARRMRLAFLDVEAAKAALPRVLAIMRDELRWSSGEVEKQRLAAMRFFKTMGHQQ